MKLKNETQVEYLDSETGELKIMTTSKTYSIPVTNDSFYMTFFENMSGFFKIKSAIELKLIIKICTLAEYNTGKCNITSYLRKDICDELEITNQQFTNNIKSLKNKNLITGERGTYMINPLIFWKGSTKERDNLIKDSILNLKITIE